MFIVALSLLTPLLVIKPTNASCYGKLFADGKYYGCSDDHSWLGGEAPKGITVSIANKKITLNNYNGGPIGITSNDYGFDGNYEIELIGENTIISSIITDSSTAIYNENVSFLNMSPVFTGTGTLKIVNASIPFYNEDNGNNKMSITIISGEAEKKTEDKTEAKADGKTEVEAGPSDTEKEGPNPTTSFFETAPGLALLIAVPSVLVIIIIILPIALARKPAKHISIAENENTPDMH